MKYSDYQWWIFTVIVPTVLLAAVFDYKRRRIPNFLTFPSMAAGLIIHTLHAGWNGFHLSLLGLIVGGGVFCIFYLMGGLGAGDVKLMGSVGALIGADKVVTAMILTTCVGAVMALYTLLVRYSFKNIPRRFLKLLDKRCVFFKNRLNSPEDTIPYGIAIAIGTLIALTLYKDQIL